MDLKVTGVIPVYNHEHAVPAVAANLRAYGLPVVLVDDGSNDSCRLALEKLSAETGDVARNATRRASRRIIEHLAQQRPAA